MAYIIILDRHRKWKLILLVSGRGLGTDTSMVAAVVA